LDHIDRALLDTEIHAKFSKEQIGIGLQLIYSSTLPAEAEHRPPCFPAAFQNLIAVGSLR
jgi:hypothetical protein